MGSHVPVGVVSQVRHVRPGSMTVKEFSGPSPVSVRRDSLGSAVKKWHLHNVDTNIGRSNSNDNVVALAGAVVGSIIAIFVIATIIVAFVQRRHSKDFTAYTVPKVSVSLLEFTFFDSVAK